MLHFCQQSDRLCLCMLRWANKRCKIESNDMTSSQHIGALIFCLQRLMVRCFQAFDSIFPSGKKTSRPTPPPIIHLEILALTPPPFSLQPSSPNPILETTHNPHSPNRSNKGLNARNISFRNSLWCPIYIINSVNKAKLSLLTEQVLSLGNHLSHHRCLQIPRMSIETSRCQFFLTQL